MTDWPGHTSKQREILVLLSDPDPQACEAVKATLLSEVNRLNDAGDPHPLLPLQPHLRTVIVSAWTQENERVARLCNTFGIHLHMIGNYSVARHYFERVLAIREKVLVALGGRSFLCD